jgi:hypothetical protein
MLVLMQANIVTDFIRPWAVVIKSAITATGLKKPKSNGLTAFRQPFSGQFSNSAPQAFKPV